MGRSATPGSEASGSGAPGSQPPESGAQRATEQRAETQSELVIARRIRAQALVSERPAAAVAADIHDACEPTFGTTWIRAYRLAHGIALTDVVEQVRAWFEHDGRKPPRFSETLLSAYESAQKRPGPEYLHYLCAVYRANPDDLGYPGRCLCGRSHQMNGAGMAGRRAGEAATMPGPGGHSGLVRPGANSAHADGGGYAVGAHPYPRYAAGTHQVAAHQGAAGASAGRAGANSLAGHGNEVSGAAGSVAGYPVNGAAATRAPISDVPGAGTGVAAAHAVNSVSPAHAVGAAGAANASSAADPGTAAFRASAAYPATTAAGNPAATGDPDTYGNPAASGNPATAVSPATAANAANAANAASAASAASSGNGVAGHGAAPGEQSAAAYRRAGAVASETGALANVAGALSDMAGAVASEGGVIKGGTIEGGAPIAGQGGTPTTPGIAAATPAHAPAATGGPPPGGARLGRAGIAETPVTEAPITGAGSTGDALPCRSAAADEDVLRQTLLEVMTGSGVNLDSRFFGVVDGVRRRMDGALLRGSVSATMMDRWEETAAGYGRQYMTVPALRVLCDVLLDVGEVRRMCEERQQIEFQERLCRVAAQLTALTGMIMIDLGDQRLARSFFRTARIAADETGDRCLRAWVTVREALVPLYYGDPREAVTLAHASGDLAGRNACVANAMAPLVEARALARLAGPGRSTADQARRLIARAHAAFDQLGHDQRSDTAFGYTTRQLLFHEGNALAALGAAEADRVLAEALAQYPKIEHLDRSLISFDRATCKLSAGNVEEALRIGQQTISQLPADYRPAILFQRARDLGHAAAGKAGQVPAVRMYQQMIVGR